MASCGDVPTLEVLAAVSLLREHLPSLKVRVVNVVDLMRLKPESEHPHGLSDAEFEAMFTTEKPVIFAYDVFARSADTGALKVVLTRQDDE
jgi:xylulose-5-phosphate/fructose-6-phosphate phosphoketolase